MNSCRISAKRPIGFSLNLKFNYTQHNPVIKLLFASNFGLWTINFDFFGAKLIFFEIRMMKGTRCDMIGKEKPTKV